MDIDWTRITPTGFEELCYKVLEKEGFLNLTWNGMRGSDRGRDIMCNKIEYPLRGFVKNETYMTQCKRYTSDPPSVTDLEDALTWAKAHKPDVVLIMLSNILTSGTQDWLEKIRDTVSFDILIYDEKNFETFFEENKEIFINFFELPEGYEYYQIEEMKSDIIHLLTNAFSISVLELSDLSGIDQKLLDSLNGLLEKEKIIEKADNEIIIKTDHDAFINASKYMLSSKYKFVYSLSEYIEKTLNVELIKYLLKRYKLSFTEKEIIVINNLALLSPSCMYNILTENVDRYETMIQQMIELNYDEKQKEKWNHVGVVNVLSRFVMNLLMDKENPEGSTLIRVKGIRGFKLEIGVKMASQEKFLFGVNTESVIMFQKAGEDIKAGQLVSVNTPKVFLESSQIYANLDLFDQAIADIDMAIEGLKGTVDEKIAWNNKGVIYERIGDTIEAIKCYEKALSLDPEFEVAKNNLKRLSQ